MLWGLALGSFTTCVMYRVPRGLSLWQQKDGSYRSFCPSCKTELQPVDLIPVLSWAWQRGKCRHCGAKIGLFYPMVELAVLAAVLLLAAILQSAWVFPAAFAVPGLVGLWGVAKRASKL